MKYKVLMVCLGNICRSPLAAGLLNFAAEAKDLAEHLEIDSAGTSSNHVGEKPDPRSLQTAINHGFQLTHEGRQIDLDDLDYFDEILVMDEDNLRDVLKIAKTPDQKAKVRLISEYDPRKEKPVNVPDPYYGDLEQFEEVYEQLWYCCMGFLKNAN
jgi:protein-tyrosine-phosphatase